MRVLGNLTLTNLAISKYYGESAFLRPPNNDKLSFVTISNSKFSYFTANLYASFTKRTQLDVYKSQFKRFTETPVYLNADYPNQPTDFHNYGIRNTSIATFYYSAFVGCQSNSAGNTWNDKSGGAVYFNSASSSASFTHCSFQSC